MRRLQTYTPAAGVFVLALLVRVLYNLTVARNYTPVFDAALYHTLGRQLVERGCYCLYSHSPSVSRPPLWPFILAIIYALIRKEELYGRLFYCFLGSGTYTLIYFFSRDLFGRKIALLSGLLAAIYPCLFIYDGWLYAESLYAFCVTAFTYSLYRLQLHYATLAALARPNGIFLPGLLVLWAVLVVLTKIQTWKPVLKDTVLIVFIAAIIILPWSYRNYQVSHSFVLVSTGMGEVLSGAYNNAVFKGGPSISGTWQPISGSLHHDAYNYTPRNDAADTARALSWMRTHFSTLPYLLGLHFINMWIPYTYSHGLAFEELPGSFMFYFMICMIYALATLVMLSAFAGLFLTWKQYKRQLLAVYLLLALVVLQNVLFHSDMRFRAPIEPMLVLLAGRTFYGLIPAGWNWLHTQIHGKLVSRVKNNQDAGVYTIAPEVLSVSTRNGTMQQM